MVPLGWIQMQSRDSDDEDSAAKQMQAILQSGKMPTAVFCAADIYAIGAIRAVKHAGLRVPEDISIMGIDDILISSYIDPPLTTVCIDTNLLATRGCSMHLNWRLSSALRSRRSSDIRSVAALPSALL